MTAIKAVIALAMAASLSGCAGLLGPSGWVASNAVTLGNFVLSSSAVTMGNQAYLTTKQLIHREPPAEPVKAEPVP